MSVGKPLWNLFIFFFNSFVNKSLCWVYLLFLCMYMVLLLRKIKYIKYEFKIILKRFTCSLLLYFSITSSSIWFWKEFFYRLCISRIYKWLKFFFFSLKFFFMITCFLGKTCWMENNPTFSLFFPAQVIQVIQFSFIFCFLQNFKICF